MSARVGEIRGGGLAGHINELYERDLHKDEGVSLPQLLSYKLNRN